LVGNATKKKKKPKRKSTKWILIIYPCKVCITNCCFKWIFIDSFLLFDVYQLYESIYWSKWSMIGQIFHNSKI
jgi:hypothetical protein